MVLLTRRVILGTTCVAILLRTLRSVEVDSFRGDWDKPQPEAMILHKIETLAADPLPSFLGPSPPPSVPPRGPHEQCTIVELHNRKGCLYQPKSILSLDVDNAIPTPSSSITSTTNGSSRSTSPTHPGGVHHGSPHHHHHHRQQQQPFGPPQAYPWRDGYKVTSSEALDLQPLLNSRLTGYGGADVATSFLSPPFKNDGGKHYSLWLLGDTFLGKMIEGANGEKKRVPGYFVHNSVALIPVWEAPGEEADPVEVVFWHGLSSTSSSSENGRKDRGVSPFPSPSLDEGGKEGGREEGGGCPESLFRVAMESARKDENECHEGGEYLWPISGLGVDLSSSSSSSNSVSSNSSSSSSSIGGSSNSSGSNYNNNNDYASSLILLATRWAYLPWIETDVNLTRSVFNFQVLGTTLIVVDNTHLPPPQWSYRLKDLPFTSSSDNWFQAMALAREEEEQEGEQGGGSDGRRRRGFVARNVEEMVYLMGTTSRLEEGGTEEGKEGEGVPRQILGKVPVKGLLDLSLQGMEVWGSNSSSSSSSSSSSRSESDGATAATRAAVAVPAADGGAAASVPSTISENDSVPPPSSTSSSTLFWAPLSLYVSSSSSSSSSSTFVPSTILSPVYTGISLHFHPYLQRWYSISIDWINKIVLLQSSRLITGPWDSTPIYSLPSPFNSSTLMAYSGKAHPELATKDNEIVFTYVVNTPGVVYPLFEEGADVLYVPRFIRLVFEKEKGKEGEGGKGGGKRGLRNGKLMIEGEEGEGDESSLIEVAEGGSLLRKSW